MTTLLPEPDALVEDAGLYEPFEPTTELISCHHADPRMVLMYDDALVGGDILRLVTAGMYNNPLVIYREYLQNAADSLASLRDGTGSVSVALSTQSSHRSPSWTMAPVFRQPRPFVA